MTKLTKAQLALQYAARGWKVFPIAAGTKDKPQVKWGKEATDDAAIVSQWWRRDPDYNIGIAVGPSGLAIVDLDDKPSKIKGKPDKQGSKRWAELEFEHGIAPQTLRVRTPSGGTHLYYRGEVRNSVDRLADGVDTRGSGGMGGYVLAAGSELLEGRGDHTPGFYTVVEEAEVADLPGWVSPLLGRATADRTEHQGKVAVKDLDTPWALEWAERHLSVDCKVAVAGEGGNNTAFRIACECRDKGLSRDAIAAMMIEHYNPRCEPPWTDEEIETFATNAWNYGDVVKAGGDTPEAHFGGEDDFGLAGQPPSIDEFSAQGARPLASGRPAEDTKSGKQKTSTDGTSSRSFRDDWVWIAQQKVFMRRKDKFMYDIASFDSMFGYLGEKGKVTPMILQGGQGVMPKFETVAFLPGESEMGLDVYNTWATPRLKPKEGDTAVFHEHMEKLLPSETERNAALDWMAWVLQNERLKPNFMFLMQGEQGCGKSWLGVLMTKLVDQRNTTVLRTEDVGNRFNSWILTTRLAVVEELMGDDKRTLANRMKALITQDIITVEMKGRDVITMPNKACFMAFTNHLDALKLENSDRRYLIFSTKAKGLGTPLEYWDRLWAFVGGDDGPAAVMHELLVRQVDRRFGLGRAPHTKAHDTMRREGLPELERWMIDAFEDGNPPFDNDLIAASDVELHLPPRMQRMNGLHKIIPSFMREEIKAVNLGAHRVPGLPSKRLWSVRRHELYAQMQPKTRVERYLKSGLGSTVGDDFNDDVDVMADSHDDPLA